MRECVFRCGKWQDGLPNPTGNLSLSEREGKKEWGERKGERKMRESESEGGWGIWSWGKIDKK